MKFYDPNDHSVYNFILTLLMYIQINQSCRLFFLAVLNKHYILKFQDTENILIHNS